MLLHDALNWSITSNFDRYHSNTTTHISINRINSSQIFRIFLITFSLYLQNKPNQSLLQSIIVSLKDKHIHTQRGINVKCGKPPLTTKMHLHNKWLWRNIITQKIYAVLWDSLVICIDFRPPEYNVQCPRLFAKLRKKSYPNKSNESIGFGFALDGQKRSSLFSFFKIFKGKLKKCLF